MGLVGCGGVAGTGERRGRFTVGNERERHNCAVTFHSSRSYSPRARRVARASVTEATMYAPRECANLAPGWGRDGEMAPDGRRADGAQQRRARPQLRGIASKSE